MNEQIKKISKDFFKTIYSNKTIIIYKNICFDNLIIEAIENNRIINRKIIPFETIETQKFRIYNEFLNEIKKGSKVINTYKYMK